MRWVRCFYCHRHITPSKATHTSWGDWECKDVEACRKAIDRMTHKDTM